MRILQLQSRKASRGGADAVVAREGEWLRDHGHDVVLLELPPVTATNPIQQAVAAVRAVHNPTSVRAVREAWQRHRADVVHVHSPTPGGSPSIIRAARELAPVVVGTTHSFQYLCMQAMLTRDGQRCTDCIDQHSVLPGVRHACYHGRAGSVAMGASLALHRRIGTFASLDTLFVMSPFHLAIHERWPLGPPMVLRRNGVPDPLPLAEPAEGIDLLFVGRLESDKNIDWLADVLRELPAGIRVRVIGGGSMRGLLDEAALVARCEVDLVGEQPHEQVFRAMAAARLALVPSLSPEVGFPLTAIEALACGTPVALRDQPSFRADAEGTYRPPLWLTGDATVDAGALVEALARIGDQDRIDARAAWQGHFTLDASMQQYVEVLTGLLAAAGPGTGQSPSALR